MKFISSKLLALLLLALLTTIVTVKARPGHGRHGRPGPASREVRAYVQENVRPVVLQQRLKLESQLAAEDKTLLVTYRTQLKDLRQRGKALHQGLRSAEETEGTRPMLTDAQKQQREQLHTERKAIMDQVKLLAVKYDSDIQKLAEEVAPQREKWAADIKAIVAKNVKPEQPGGEPPLAGRAGHHGGHHRGAGRPFSPVRFLLMDPTAPAAATRALGNSSMYPNPAVATSQLEYSVKKAGPVSIDLLDSRGNKLRTLLPETSQEKGAHTQPLNVSDLPSGTYYYKITTRSGTETKRFVKE